MRRALVALAALTALALAPQVSAKEPFAATIDGPGLDNPITIQGSTDERDGSALARMSVAGGVGAAMFGHRVPDPMQREQPSGSLGPRYSVTYTVMGPDGKNYYIHQDLYPYATPRPLTYVEPGKEFFPGFFTHGGWFVGGPKLKQALHDAGLPARAPQTSGLSSAALGGIGLGGALVLALSALLAMRLRRRHAA